MTQIGDALVDFNPWWKGEFRLEYRDRDVYQDIRKVLAHRVILRQTLEQKVEADVLLEEVLVANAGMGRQHGHENLHRIPSTARATSTG